MRTRPRSWLAPALPFPFSPALLGLVALLAVPVACGGGSGGAGGSGATGTGGASSSSSSGAAGHGGNGGGMGGSGGIGGSGGGTVFDPASCAPEEIRCVDDDPGPSAEYPTIQAAVDACSPGDTVLVFAGGYPGFRVSKSGTAQAPISVRAEAGVVFTGPEALTHNVIRIQAASHVHIEGFRIQGSGLPNPYDYDHACLAARGATADAPMEGIVLRGNDISGCSPSGMYLSQTRGLVLEDNVIHDNVLEAENGNGNGVYLANAGTDEVIVRGNRFTGNAGNGIHFNGDASVGGDGVQTGHLFERNVIADNGVNGFNMDGVQGSTFVNNLFANNGRHGVRGFAIDAAEGPKDDVFINNTFVGNAGAGVKMSEDAGGHVLFNDLFIGNAEGGIVIEETTPLTSNNLDQAPSAGVFADAAAKDYHLAAGSPAIDAGIASFAGEAAPADDLSGAARSGAPDLGCYER